MVGAEDVFDAGTLGRGLAEALGAPPPHVIAGAGHTPSMETPPAFDAMLLDFLAR